MQNMKYCEYFNVNESYFPCIDESAINAGAKWEDTYPHETFIELIDGVEKMLGGSTNRSVWIHGAYGTGKSRCAYTLKKILEVPEDELRLYWDSYEALKKSNTLLEKIVGHKEKGILTAYRYASGDISSPNKFFEAVQDSLKRALETSNIEYKGANTLKECAIEWLSDSAHKNLINELLQRPEWMATFSQSNADEIINSLRKGSDVSELMDNIFKLADKEGIRALSLNADNLRDWIIDIIDKNQIKIVFIWDEFSDFFRQNKNSLGEFQKIVSICQEKPFYFIVVTHPITSLSSNDDSWKIVQQRFNKTEIKLPDNIAFDLTADAFKVKDAAKDSWFEITEDLDASVSSAKQAVMASAGVKNPSVMRNILPIHPMTALVLKNIATSFQSNQRSMFDFIKTPKDMDVKAFQWFIQNTSPMAEDGRKLLTVDMLWNFFYEKGKDYLSNDIRLILDTYPQHTSLRDNQKIVLKTILIMQAVDQRLGGSIPLLKTTDQNLKYAFEGDDGELESNCVNIAKTLVEAGVLIQTPIGDGKKVYAAAVLAGDGAKIEAYKNDIRKNSTTSKLVSDGAALATALNLTPALKLRYAKTADIGDIPITTITDFAKTMDALKNKDDSWRFYAVLTVARNEDEAQSFRTLIKTTVSVEAYKNILVIDALSTPLGIEAFEQYVEYSAMSMYYQGNQNQQSKDNAKKAKDVLERDWKSRIYDGQFVVYSYSNQDGEKAMGANAVLSILQVNVLKKYKYVFDFTKGLTESQLKLTQAKNAARYGMCDADVKGVVAGCDKNVLGKVWKIERYWEIPELAEEPISIIKKAVDKMVNDAFLATGKISIDEIYSLLENTYGFAPCNMTAFVVGFLLKEYNTDPYRCMDAEGHRVSMTPDKLSEMLGNYIGKTSPKSTYIVSLTDEEKAFYALTEEAWSIAPNTCSSPNHAVALIQSKMRELSYPAWCLEDVDTAGVFDVLKMFISLVQSKGDEAHGIAKNIGEIALNRKSIGKSLSELITKANCRKGMELFLKHRFDDGKLMRLAEDIGAQDRVLSDVEDKFNVKHSSLWVNSTGEDEINKLIIEYSIIKITNNLLNVATNKLSAAFDKWREVLKFIGFSCEAAKAKYTSLDKVFGYWLKIANRDDILSDGLNEFYSELTEHCTDIKDILNDTLNVFAEIYAPYLEGLEPDEVERIRNSISSDMFVLSSTQSNGNVKKAVEEYKKNQIKTKLFKLWSEKADNTKNPRDWSEKYQTPILCCIDESIYSEAKKAFSVLNSSSHSEAEIKSALEFIETATFFDDISKQDFRDSKFMSAIVGSYSVLLPDINIVRNYLDKLAIDVYEWSDNPTIKAKIKKMADAEYNAGGSDKALGIIDGMSDAELKQRLKELTKSDPELGVKILISGKG